MKCSLVLFSLILTACSHVESNPMQGYLALAPAEPNAQSNKRIQAFIELYDQLDDDLIDKKIAETYAEKNLFQRHIGRYPRSPELIAVFEAYPATARLHQV